MKTIEYKAVMLDIKKRGLFSTFVAPNCVSEIEQTLNMLGRQGWELVAIFPFTNGGSPAQIEQAIHYFRRQGIVAPD